MRTTQQHAQCDSKPNDDAKAASEEAGKEPMMTTHIAVAEGSANQDTSVKATSDERATYRSLIRLGSIAALVGTVLLFVSTLLHPLGRDANVPPAAFAEYAADSLWVWSHLGQFLGIAILVIALVALASTLEPGPARAWSHVGLTGAAATIAVAAALQAVDGVALKVMVDRWAASSGEARVLAYEGAFAVRQIEIGLASLLSVVSGVTLGAFGIAILRSTRYPAWLGAFGLVGSLGLLASGAAQASTGFSGLAMALSMPSSIALLVWSILIGAFMWRSVARLTGDSEDTSQRLIKEPA